MTDYLAQVVHQRDQARRDLRAAEAELGQRRTCEALVLAILDGWGVAGAEADLMRHEIRQALLLAGANSVVPRPVHECRVWECSGEWNVSCTACPDAVDNIGSEDDAEQWAARHLAAGDQSGVRS